MCKKLGSIEQERKRSWCFDFRR